MLKHPGDMWEFTAVGIKYPSTIYLHDDEIIGAIVESEREANPQLILLTKNSGTIKISWQLHHVEIVTYIEGKEDA